MMLTPGQSHAWVAAGLLQTDWETGKPIQVAQAQAGRQNPVAGHHHADLPLRLKSRRSWHSPMAAWVSPGCARKLNVATCSPRKSRAGFMSRWTASRR